MPQSGTLSGSVAAPPIVTPGTAVAIATSSELAASWAWLKAAVSRRSSRGSSEEYLYDHKQWHGQPLGDDVATVGHLGFLYLASVLGDTLRLNQVGNSDACFIVETLAPLDSDLKKVLLKEDRFRASFAEHLAFWVRSTDAAHFAPVAKFAQTQPHLQPEDKGLDGLILHAFPTPILEVQSVKNSINDPKPLVSSASFRSKGVAKPKKQLDEYSLLATGISGTLRLQRALSPLVSALQLGWHEKLQAAIAMTSQYNAVVVADSAHGNAALFKGYEHVTDAADRRIATFIGAAKWASVASATRKHVITCLKNLGLF